MATTAKVAKEAKTPKYKIRHAQPLQAVRPAARVHAQVRTCAVCASASWRSKATSRA